MRADVTTRSFFQRTKRPFFWVLVVMSVLTLLSAGWVFDWVIARHRLTAVTPGQVYRSGAMPSKLMVETVQRLGIRTVIDLRMDSSVVDKEHTLMSSMGVAHHNLPSEQVPDPATVDRFLELIDHVDRPILIHCTHGEGRAVLFSAIYCIEVKSWSNDRARHTCRFFPSVSSFALDEPKGHYLDNYKSRTHEENHTHNVMQFRHGR